MYASEASLDQKINTRDSLRNAEISTCNSCRKDTVQRRRYRVERCRNGRYKKERTGKQKYRKERDRKMSEADRKREDWDLSSFVGLVGLIANS